MANKSDTKGSRGRSPSYPFLSLKKAIDLADKFYNEEGKHKAIPDIAIEHLGYKASSSTGIRALAALTSFGLLDADGAGVERRVWVSELGRAILLDLREKSPERMKAVQEAALKPPIYRELWERWGSDLPSEATIKTVLLKDLDFNAAALGPFIKNMKATFEFARLSGLSEMSEEEFADDVEEEEDVEQEVSTKLNPKKPSHTPNVEIQSITLPLIGGGMAILQIPVPLSEENFDFLVGLLGSMKKALIKKEVDGEFLLVDKEID